MNKSNTCVNQYDLLAELTKENESLLNQLLMAQIEIEKLDGSLNLAKTRHSEVKKAIFQYLEGILAGHIRNEKEKLLRKEISESREKCVKLIQREKIWKKFVRDKGKKFAISCQKARNAVQKGESAEKIAWFVRKEGLNAMDAASAFTELARIAEKPELKAELAFHAWALHPVPFRLKWLAFRCYDMKDACRAAFFMDMLPPSISLAESEIAKAQKIQEHSDKYYIEQARTLFNTLIEAPVFQADDVLETAVNSSNQPDAVNEYRKSCEILQKYLSSRV